MGEPSSTTFTAAVVEPPPPIELGDYRLSRQLRCDDAEATWLAQDKRLGRAAVVKLAPAEAALGSEIARRRDELLAGARRAAALRDAASAPVFEIGNAGNVTFIARAFVPGRCLQKALAQRAPLEVFKAVQLVADLTAVLARIHRMGAAHGNLKPSNVILAEARSQSDVSHGARDFAPLVLVDFRDAGPGAMLGDVRATGQLLHELLQYAGAGKPPPEAPHFDQQLDRILRQTLGAAGVDDPKRMEQLSLDLALWLGRRSPVGDERSLVARWWRPILLLGGGVSLLGVAGMLLALHIVMFLSVGLAQLGPLLQSSAEMVAIPLVSGIYLLMIAKRSIARLLGRDERAEKSGPLLAESHERDLVAGPAPSKFANEETARAESPTGDGFLPTVAPTSLELAASSGATSVSMSLGALLSESPACMRVRLDASAKQIIITRRRSRAAGILIALATLAVALATFIQAARALAQVQGAWLAPFAASAIPAAAYLALVLWLNRRWVVDPVRSPDLERKRVKTSQRNWKSLFVREQLALSPEGMILDPPDGGDRRNSPWRELWDVREGTRAEGIEMATLAAPLYFGAGLADGDRAWLARVVRLFKSDPAGAASIAQLPRKAKRSFLNVARFALAATLAAVVVLLATVELMAGLFGPIMFAPDNPWRPVEIVLDGTARMAVLCNAAFVSIGLLRLAKRRRSGAALVKIGLGMKLAWYAFMFVFVRYLHAAGIFTASVAVTPAINVSTAAVGLSMWLQIALVSSVFLFEERLRLQDD